MTLWSQVLALLSDTGRRGQTLLSVPKHSQTSQDAVKTPPRRPRGLQDRYKNPKMTPKAPPRGLMLEPRDFQKTNKNKQVLKVFRESSLWAQDKLQIAPRTLQDAPRCPTTSNMGPTWAQHGANMGSTRAPRSVQGGSNCSPEGVSSSDCSPTAHMDPTWTPHGPQMHPK